MPNLPDIVNQRSAGKQQRFPVRLPTHQIVSPEPHSKAPISADAWYYTPRWLKIVVLLGIIVAGILVAVFVK